jgi:hypothetical protein
MKLISRTVKGKILQLIPDFCWQTSSEVYEMLSLYFKTISNPYVRMTINKLVLSGYLEKRKFTGGRIKPVNGRPGVPQSHMPLFEYKRKELQDEQTNLL